MSSQSSQSVLSMSNYKDVLAESSSVAKPSYSETGHLHQENRLLPRTVWFKGSRDRGFREDIAAWNQFKQP